MNGHILVERRGAIQVIRIDRPEKRNALTCAMYAAMAGALAGGDADPEVRCHVLLGRPGVFSAGNDLGDFMTIAAGGEGGREVYDFLLALAGAQKPLVSGVDGIAVGIGTTIHLHCDLTLATPETVFSTPFVDLGLVPEAGSSLLAPALMGRQRAFALLALGETLTAPEAHAAGLVHKVVEGRHLEAAVLAVAGALAEKPQEALRITRELIRGPRRRLLERIEEEAGHFRARLASPEAREAFAAFMARRSGA